MKAVVFEGVDRWAVTDRAEANVGEDQVRVKVAACGLCGTDLHILKGEYPSSFPLIPGHEFAGTVVDAGPAVTDIAAGTRVCVDPNICCHACPFCREGKVHLCERLFPVGVKRDGGFAQFCTVPRSQVYAVPDTVELIEAAMTEPLSCAVHGIELAHIQPGQSVLILGGGAMGGLLAQLARSAGAGWVIVSEPQEGRRRLLLQVAADAVIDPQGQDVAGSLRRMEPAGADVVFEAAGLAVTAKQCFSVAKRGGTIIFFGVTAPQQRIEVSPYEIYANEWTVRGSFINPFTFRRAVALLAARRVNVKPFIRHQFPLADFGEALKAFGRPDSYKVQILCN